MFKSSVSLAVAEALEVESQFLKDETKQNNNGNTNVAAVSSSSKSVKYNDEHNEVCEVCEKGGELLCCETCSLVFHLKCLRPKLAIVPKGRWSCPYCILDVSNCLRSSCCYM